MVQKRRFASVSEITGGVWREGKRAEAEWPKFRGPVRQRDGYFCVSTW